MKALVSKISAQLVPGDDAPLADASGNNGAAIRLPDVISEPVKWANWGILAFLGIFLLWSILAPINSAAIAPGLLRAEGGGRKTIQHLEGGIISEILVKEGQSVSKGQALARLDRTQSSAVGSSLQAQYDALLAQDARLSAEVSRSGDVRFPEELTSRADDPKVAELLNGQRLLFLNRKQSLFSHLSILETRLSQAQAEIDSYQAQINSIDEQRRLMAEEISNVSALVNEGLERQSRLLALQRQQAANDGSRGQMVASIARVRQSMAETQSQMVYARNSLLTEVTGQQRDVRTQIAELSERLKASKDVNRRREITSPVDGRVVNLRFVTRGGVVRPGDAIMDIVPRNEKIIVLARLRATDVDSVYEGQTAKVQLTSYKSRMVPMLDATVISVGADAAIDERSNAHFYETQVALNEGELKKLENVHLISGMPAEVFIDLGERSLLRYFFQPMLDSFHRAFREV